MVKIQFVKIVNLVIFTANPLFFRKKQSQNILQKDKFTTFE